MKKTKTVSLDIPSELTAAFSEAITQYAYGAFPPGRSSCTQVSRETLLDTARIIQQANGAAEVRRRQLPMLKAAITWYFGPDGPSPSDSLKSYLVILEG